ncbi:hypothetical protein COCON_G00137380 [Conger conger]|uniref:C2H2-type domain-containing protein n=1 Tax=Conger conger TaxID=82655 RepID=A0A9Q1DFI2_CONCO|nr:hypothetical protein COCON_G00137380 [Conger conger]
MPGSTSDSVSVFQTQVASVLEVLLNLAVVEITKLFENGCVVSEGSAISNVRTNSKTCAQDELRTRAESLLGKLKKHIHSAGVQVRVGGKRRSDGEQALPATERGAVFWEGGGHANASRTEVLEVEGQQSRALECELAGVPSPSPPRAAAAPLAGRGGTDAVVLETGPVDSSAEEEDSALLNPKGSTAPHAPGELVAQPPPVKELTPRAELPAELSPALTTPRLAPPLAGGPLRPCSVQLVNVLLIFGGGGGGRRGPAGRGRKGADLPRDLRAHQRLHTGTRPCCFTACGNGKFKRRKVLKRHRRFHTGERPYSCGRCGKTFALRKNLRRHERFHTGERPHRCAQCGKRFRLRQSLKSHQRFHTGERPYGCGQCARRFRVMRNLARHQATHRGPPPALLALKQEEPDRAPGQAPGHDAPAPGPEAGGT